MPTIVGQTERIETGTLEVGRGPLLDYHASDEDVGDRCHWHLGDSKWTLLDLAVRLSDRAIVAVTLTLFRGPIVDRPPQAFEKAVQTDGLPTLDSVRPIGSILREPSEVSIHLGPDTLYVILDDQVDDVTCMTNPYARFFVANGRLAGIAFAPLTAAQRSDLVRILEST